VFSKVDAARLLNAPAEDTVEGLRDRAILSVGLKVGLRRAEIAALSVEDLHQNRGFDSLRIVRKGGRRDALAIHPNVAQRIRAYLDAAGHADDLDGPMFRPLSHNRKAQESWAVYGPRRHRPRAAETCEGRRFKQGIFGAFDARNLYYNGAGERHHAR
jgi:site-specific recombinase XerC